MSCHLRRTTPALTSIVIRHDTHIRPNTHKPSYSTLRYTTFHAHVSKFLHFRPSLPRRLIRLLLSLLGIHPRHFFPVVASAPSTYLSLSDVATSCAHFKGCVPQHPTFIRINKHTKRVTLTRTMMKHCSNSTELTTLTHCVRTMLHACTRVDA